MDKWTSGPTSRGCQSHVVFISRAPRLLLPLVSLPLTCGYSPTVRLSHGLALRCVSGEWRGPFFFSAPYRHTRARVLLTSRGPERDSPDCLWAKKKRGAGRDREKKEKAIDVRWLADWLSTFCRRRGATWPAIDLALAKAVSGASRGPASDKRRARTGDFWGGVSFWSHCPLSAYTTARASGETCGQQWRPEIRD
jgi:hypothetical protein